VSGADPERHDASGTASLTVSLHNAAATVVVADKEARPVRYTRAIMRFPRRRPDEPAYGGGTSVSRARGKMESAAGPIGRAADDDGGRGVESQHSRLLKGRMSPDCKETAQSMSFRVMAWIAIRHMITPKRIR